MASTDILGHSFILQSLRDDLLQNNVAHAYLFSGPEHVGKFTVAKWFSEQLLCAGADDKTCLHIKDQISRLLHPDLLVIDRLWMEESQEDIELIARSSNISQQHRIKAKAKTDTISIDDIRALQERLHEVRMGQYRCCLIRSVERMQAEAVNALLKILEEPPPGVVFLLTTQALSSVPDTLISRARVLHFHHVHEAELAPLLTGASAEERNFILRVAQGAPGIVRRLRDDPDLLRRERQAYGNATSFWHSRSPTERMRILTPLHERTAEAKQLLLHLSLAYREERSDLKPSDAEHLFRLQRNLETNVNRQLLTQQFILALAQGGR